MYRNALKRQGHCRRSPSQAEEGIPTPKSWLISSSRRCLEILSETCASQGKTATQGSWRKSALPVARSLSGLMKRFFFAMETQMNSQNHRLLAYDPYRVCIYLASWIIFRPQKPANAIFWAVVASDSSKGPLVFIEESVKVNAQVYIRLLEENDLSWVTSRYEMNTASFRMVSLFHTASCRATCPHAWVLDHGHVATILNPINYAVWVILEREVCATPHSSKHPRQHFQILTRTPCGAHASPQRNVSRQWCRPKVSIFSHSALAEMHSCSC